MASQAEASARGDEKAVDPPSGYMGQSLVFYAQYHSHPVNVAIHVIFVPVIMLSSLILLAYIPSVWNFEIDSQQWNLPHWLERSSGVNAGLLLLLFYCGLYSSWDPLAGLSWTAAVALPLLVLANQFQAEVPKAWAWALGMQVVSWYMQIYPGHAVFEGGKPALLDGLVQSFLTAPLFVWLDMLFMVGYRPELKRHVAELASKARQSGSHAAASRPKAA